MGRHSRASNSDKRTKAIRQIMSQLLFMLEQDEYRTLVVISNQGHIRVMDGQTRKLIASLDTNTANHKSIKRFYKTISHRRQRNNVLLEECSTLKDKIQEQQQLIDELYDRIEFLQQIERKYYLFSKERHDTGALPLAATQNTDFAEEVDALRKKVAELRRVNYVLREGEEREYREEHNSISYFEHRLRSALVTQLCQKLEEVGVHEYDKNDFRKFTTKELIELVHAETGSMAELVRNTGSDHYRLRRYGVAGLLKKYSREAELAQLIAAHHINDTGITGNLRYLTDNALKFLNLVPSELQVELLDKLKHSNGRIWNGAFIKGYYFLYSILEHSPTGHEILRDLDFTEKEKVKILFKETLYEIFGNFVYLEKEQLFVIPGLVGMASQLKEMTQQSIIKGIFGELIAAYYLKKAYGMDILEFQKRVVCGSAVVGEIDIIALDQDNVLWDVEVKNWSVNSMPAAESLVRKVTEQLHNAARSSCLGEVREQYEQLRSIKIREARKLAVLVRDTPYKSYIQSIHTASDPLIEVVDLVPEWLTKGIYDPAHS